MEESGIGIRKVRGTLLEGSKLSTTMFWEITNTTSLMFLPKINTLNPITKKCQKKPSEGTFYKITGLYPLTMSRSWKTKEAEEPTKET